MNTVTRLLMIVAILGFASVARADLGPPPVIDGKVKIAVDEEAKKPRLIIPNEALRPKRGGKEKIQFEGDETNLAPQNNNGWIIGGALALAFVSGGVWFVRKGASNKTLGLLAIGAIVVGMGAYAYADIPPFRPKGKEVKVPASVWEAGTDIEIVFDGKEITLVLDKKSFEKLKEAKLPEKK